MKLFKKFHVHRWTYYHNGLSRECKKCEAYEITVGETPSEYRMTGDMWVRTVESKF